MSLIELDLNSKAVCLSCIVCLGSTVKHEIFATSKCREFAILANFGT